VCCSAAIGGISAVRQESFAAGYRRLAALLRHVVAEQDVDNVLARVAETLRELVRCDDVVVWEHDGAGELSVAVAEGEDQEQLERLRIRLGEGLTGLAAAESVPVVSDDAHLDPRAGLVPGTSRVPEAVACMPLRARERVLGVLSLYRRGDDRAFSAEEVELLGDYAAVAALALENAHTRAELQALATTDDLTGLANRRQFSSQLEHEVALARRHQTPLSLLLLDLNDFKSINDTYGHQRGDTCLQAVAEAIRSRLRATDCAARIGGDEFALILPHTRRQQARRLAQSLAEAISNALPPPFQTSAAIGISTLTPSTPTSSGRTDDLLLEADRLLYNAKKHHPTHGRSTSKTPSSKRLAVQ
jgi:diguanylate cyclase (GGDEF)-like protein